MLRPSFVGFGLLTLRVFGGDGFEITLNLTLTLKRRKVWNFDRGPISRKRQECRFYILNK